VLFWGILGAIVFRIAMLGGGAFLAKRFTWVFYVFGAYLGWQGIKLLRGDDDEGGDHDKSLAIRALRRFVRIVDGDHGGKFTVQLDGRRALTTVAVCLVVIELTDIVFALDSIPAVLSVSQDTFIIITSNIFAIMGCVRSTSCSPAPWRSSSISRSRLAMAADPDRRQADPPQRGRHLARDLARR